MSTRSAHKLHTVSSTDAKNSFGEVIERAVTDGMVVITRRNKPRAVVLSIEAYEALVPRSSAVLEALGAEYDALAERMQSPTAKAAGRALFDASASELGDAARDAALRR